MNQTVRQLSREEQALFRKDFQDKESEINRYIAVYLSALAVVTGWIIGPQSKGIIELVVGNNGYNLLFWFVIVFINLVFSCFLTYKGLIIHDIMQFVTYTAESGSALLAWESWRRSRNSATLRVRSLYGGLIAAIPMIVAVVMMIAIFCFLMRPSEDLVAWGSSTRTGVLLDLRQVQLARRIGWGCWIAMLILHILPLKMFIESIGPTRQRWQHILAARSDIPCFDNLEKETIALAATAESAKLETVRTASEIGDENGQTGN